MILQYVVVRNSIPRDERITCKTLSLCVITAYLMVKFFSEILPSHAELQINADE
jgi:hypothetical protein